VSLQPRGFEQAGIQRPGGAVPNPNPRAELFRQIDGLAHQSARSGQHPGQQLEQLIGQWGAPREQVMTHFDNMKNRFVNQLRGAQPVYPFRRG
jgi:hypothetical protein